MQRFLWVCFGGAIGSGARYAVSGWVSERFGAGFPWGTLAVNVTGSFLLGAILQAAVSSAWMSETAKLTLTVGVLGGFTTYSTFNHETISYVQQGAWWLASTNVLATLLGCLAAGALGLTATKWALGG